MCEICRLSSTCMKKYEFTKQQLFALARGESIDCEEYEPRLCRGIEGVF